MRRESGFTLLVVILVIAAAFVSVSALLVSATFARSDLKDQNTLLEHKLACESIREIAFAKLESATSNDHYLVHSANSPRAPETDYIVISSFDAEQSVWCHTPMLSGKPFIKFESSPKEDSIDQWNVDEVFYPTLPKEESETTLPLTLTNLAGEKIERILPAYTLSDLEQGGPEFTAAYWIEDLGGRIDFEASFASSQKDENGQELRTPFDPFLLADLIDEKRKHFVKTWNEQQPRQIAHFDLNALASEGESRSLPFFSPLEKAEPKHLFNELWQKKYPSYALDRGALLETLSEEEKALVNRFFSLGLEHTLRRNLVPFGHDHQNAGKSQYSLNKALSELERDELGNLRDQKVSEIAEQIEATKSFSQDGEARKGGFDALHSYTKTIAANILDYADIDSQSTSSSDLGSPFFRGIDAMPFITEHGQRFLMIGNDGGPIIEVRHFVELYNPSNLTIKGFCGLEIDPDYTLGKSGASTTTGIKIDFPDFKDPNPEDENSHRRLFYHKGIIEIPANSYRVLEFKESFSKTLGAGSDFEKSICLFDDAGAPIAKARVNKASNNHLRLYWKPSEHPTETLNDFILIDATERGSFKRPSRNHTVKSTAEEHKAQTLTNSLSISESSPFADPRATFYRSIQAQPSASYYASVSYGGQNKLTYNGLETDFNQSPDFGHNHLYYGTVPDRAGGNYQYLPGENGYIHFTEDIDAPLSQVIDENRYPESYYDQDTNVGRALFQLSNRGYFWSLGELGNIYDPAQWTGLQRPYDEEGNTRSRKTAVENSEAGGGLSLAIGSSEMSFFREEKLESARLLDQFSLSLSPYHSLKGKVNLNTAEEPVLRSLFSGFIHSDDKPFGKFSRLPEAGETAKVASAITEAIISHRKLKPFLSLSDIALLETAEGVPVFGEKAVYQQDLAEEDGINQEEIWSDYGREELFRKINHLFTTTSRAFRVHTVVKFSENGAERLVQNTYEVTLHPARLEDQSIDTSQKMIFKIHHRSQETQ